MQLVTPSEVPPHSFRRNPSLRRGGKERRGRAPRFYISEEGVLRGGRARGRNAVDKREARTRTRLIASSGFRIPSTRRRDTSRSERSRTRRGAKGRRGRCSGLDGLQVVYRGRSIAAAPTMTSFVLEPGQTCHTATGDPLTPWPVPKTAGRPGRRPLGHALRLERASFPTGVSVSPPLASRSPFRLAYGVPRP